MALRTLADGSPELERQRLGGGNLLDRLQQHNRRLGQAQRQMTATPPDGTLTYPMLWPSNAYDADNGVAADMVSVDLLRLVSPHDEIILAGLPAIVGAAGGENLYFEISSMDDNATLNAVAGAYGFRAGQNETVDLGLRYQGPAGGTITLTYLNPAGSETSLYAAGGDTWVQCSGPSTHLPDGQTFTAPSTGVLSKISIWMKRSASYSGLVYVDVCAVDAGHVPTSSLLLLQPSADISAISTTGQWVDIDFITSPSLTSGVEYAILVSASANGVNTASWYKDGSAGAYAGGVSLVGGLLNWSVDTDDDYYLKITLAGTTTMTVATLAAYTGWSEVWLSALSVRFSHDFFDADNAADFYLTVPEGVALNAICIRDTISGGEVHYRCGHVRTPHIRPVAAPTTSWEPVVDTELNFVYSNDDIVMGAPTPDSTPGRVVTPPGPTWLTTPLSNGAWDYDSKTSADDGILDLSALFGVPAKAKAVLLRVSTRSTNAGSYSLIGPSSTYPDAMIGRVQVDNRAIDQSAWIPCDANGDIYFSCSGTCIMSIFVWSYAF